MADEAAAKCEALCVLAKIAEAAGFDDTGSLKVEVLFEGSNQCNVKITSDNDWPEILSKGK